MAGRIVLLNGVPRAGKSSIARALQESGDWMILGVDAMMAMMPSRLHPGIGLRPGGERPELEDFVQRSYAGLFGALAAFADSRLDVVSDVGLHDGYRSPLGLAGLAQRTLAPYQPFWVSVQCPLPEIMRRRNMDPDTRYLRGEDVPEPVRRWQESVHTGLPYDLIVDTAVLSPQACADRIVAALASRF